MMKKDRIQTAVRKTAILITMLIMTALVFAGCEQIQALRDRISGKDEQNPGSAEVPAAPIFAVNTTTAVKGQIRDYLALSGDIIAGSTVDAYSDAAGKVSRIFVEVGGRVAKGDPVAEVDPSRPGMNYVPSVAKAPISGTIVALPAQLGMTVSQAVPLARIAAGSGSTGGLEIRLYVAERFISKIAQRQPCEITLDAWPGEVFRGSVSEVAPTVDPASRTMEVRVNVDNPGSKLKAGMFAKVRLVTEEKNNIVKIPSNALIRRFGEEYVFAVEVNPADPAGYVARQKIVTPGILIDGVLEIREGLLPDEEIIVRGQTLLEDGSRINVVERLAPLSVN
jgi:multidrug efflux pump subunit AcrA (membrane-fusion protein)